MNIQFNQINTTSNLLATLINSGLFDDKQELADRISEYLDLRNLAETTIKVTDNGFIINFDDNLTSFNDLSVKDFLAYLFWSRFSAEVEPNDDYYYPVNDYLFITEDTFYKLVMDTVTVK